MTTAPEDVLVPWAPEDLPIPAEALTEHWHYAVLEEVVDEAALFRRWPWPGVDQLGHLVWPLAAEQATYAATIDLTVLRVQVYVPNSIQRRPRVGDTFAITANVSAAWRSGRARDARTLLGDWVYDISADAREAAKIAYQGSLAPVPPAEAVDEATRVQQSAAFDRRRQEPLRRLEIVVPEHRDVHHPRGRS